MRSLRIFIVGLPLALIALSQTPPTDRVWRGKPAAEIARSPDFASLPLFARFRLLARLDPKFDDLADEDQEALLFSGEKRGQSLEYFMLEHGEDGSDTWTKDGLSFSSLNLPRGLRVTITIIPWDKYESALIRATNWSKSSRFQIDPRKISFLVLEPELSAVKPVSSFEIAKRFERGAKWGAFANGFAANMATLQAEAITTGGGRATATGPYGSVTVNDSYSERTTVTAPDYQRQRQAAMENQQRIYAARQRGQSIIDRALKANTLFPGDDLIGFVDFERPKGPMDAAVLRLIVDDMSIEFPLHRPR